MSAFDFCPTKDMIKDCKAPAVFEDSCKILRQNSGAKVFTPAMGVCYIYSFDQKVDAAKVGSGLELEIDIESKSGSLTIRV